MAAILDRMTTADPDRRMPYNRFIESVDAAEITQWVSDQE
jgi:hypothetical protein